MWKTGKILGMLLTAKTCLGLQMTGTVPTLLIFHYCSFFGSSESISGHFLISYLFVGMALPKVKSSHIYQDPFENFFA